MAHVGQHSQAGNFFNWSPSWSPSIIPALQLSLFSPEVIPTFIPALSRTKKQNPRNAKRIIAIHDPFESCGRRLHFITIITSAPAFGSNTFPQIFRSLFTCMCVLCVYAYALGERDLYKGRGFLLVIGVNLDWRIVHTNGGLCYTLPVHFSWSFYSLSSLAVTADFIIGRP